MRPWSHVKVDESASPFLHVHRTRAHPVLEHHAFGVEVGEGRPFLHVRQHGRLTHPEPAVLSTSAATVGEHVQERILVDVVVTFAQSFGAVFVSGSETIVRLAAQLHKPVTGPLHLEQTRYALRALQHVSSTHGRLASRQCTYSFRWSSQHSDGSYSERCRK